jgi:predicted metal-dependent hydrolase
LFEQSEVVFCNIIKSFNKTVTDPILKREVEILFAQESWHRYNHSEFNKQIQKYYNIDHIEKKARNLLNKVFLLQDKNMLSYCVSFEHLTCIITKPLIDENYNNTDTEVSNFWIWHALEEQEHGFVIKKLFKYFKCNQLANYIHMYHMWLMYGWFVFSSMTELIIQDCVSIKKNKLFNFKMF